MEEGEVVSDSPDNGQSACDQIRLRLTGLFPEMTFRVLPQNGTVAARIALPATIRIFGQRTRNMRYDRANYYASFDIAGEDYLTAETGGSVEALLQAAMANLDAQLRLRNQ